MTAHAIRLKKDQVLRPSWPLSLHESDRVKFECDPALECDMLKLQREGHEPILLPVHDGTSEASAAALLGAEVQLWSVSVLRRPQVTETPESLTHYRNPEAASEWILCAQIEIEPRSLASIRRRAQRFLGILPCLFLAPLGLQHGMLSKGVKLTVGSVVLISLTLLLFALFRSERMRKSVAYKTYVFISAAVVIVGLNALLTRTVTVRLHTRTPALVEQFSEESVWFFTELDHAVPDIAVRGARLVAPQQLHHCLRNASRFTWTLQAQAIECENRWTTASSEMRAALGIISSPDAAELACVDLSPQSCDPVGDASEALNDFLGPTLQLQNTPRTSGQQEPVDPSVWRPTVTGFTRISLTDERLRSSHTDSVRTLEVEVYGAADLTEIRLTDAPASRWSVQITPMRKTRTALSISYLTPTDPTGSGSLYNNGSHAMSHFELSFREHAPIGIDCNDYAEKIQVFEFSSPDFRVVMNSNRDQSANPRQLLARCVQRAGDSPVIQLAASASVVEGFRGAPFDWQAVQRFRFPHDTRAIDITAPLTGPGDPIEIGGSACDTSSRNPKRVLIFELQPIFTWINGRTGADLAAVGGLIGPDRRRVFSPTLDGVKYGVLCVDAGPNNESEPTEEPNPVTLSPITLGVDNYTASMRDSFGRDCHGTSGEVAVWPQLWNVIPAAVSTNDPTVHPARLEWFGPAREPPPHIVLRCPIIGDFGFGYPSPAAARQAELDLPCENFGCARNYRGHPELPFGR